MKQVRGTRYLLDWRERSEELEEWMIGITGMQRKRKFES
jgi:hypothetical protein